MHMHKPTEAHARLSDRVLGYIRHTSELRLRFAPETLQLQAYIDASYAIHAYCRSHHSAFIRLGSTPFPFHVKSSAIKSIVRSSTVRMILPLTCFGQIDLMTELGFPSQPVHVFEDNQNVVELLASPDLHF